MINLIPPEGLRVVKMEYFLRVGATFCFLFGFTILLITVALIPTYVLVDAQIKTIENSTAEYQKQNETLTTLDQEVRTTMLVVNKLKGGNNTITSSQVIGAIYQSAPSGIVFKSFLVEQDDAGMVSVQARGVAPTREVLVKLKTTLESAELFEEAVIPIGDLARDTNLPFVITISLAKETV